MTRVGLAEAKARLSALIAQVEAGEEVVITRHGRPIARLASVEQTKQALRPLAAFRAGMPALRRPSVDVLRDLRDDER